MSALYLTAEQINGWIGQFLWPLFRISGLLAVMPVLGGGEVPVRVRAALALMLTLIIVPSVGPVPQVDPLSVDSVLICFQQLLIGIAMGLLILIAFSAVTMAGESIAVSMGLGFAVLNDPQNGMQVPMVSQFYLVMATLLFLAVDGHHEVLRLLGSSFSLMPIGQALGQDSIQTLLRWAAMMFYGALAIALPALGAMLTINLIMGIITRAAPQLNLFSVGFPVTLTLGLLAILYTLPAFQFAFINLLELTHGTIVQLLSQ